jgi:hypothetical protein
LAVAGDPLVEHDSDRRARLTLSTSVSFGDVPDRRAALGYGISHSRLAGRVVRGAGSPGSLFVESTGFVSAAFTDKSPASIALLSPVAAEEFALPCALPPERSALTAPRPAG